MEGGIFFQRHPASFTVIAFELRGRWGDQKTGLKQSSTRQEAAVTSLPRLCRGGVSFLPLRCSGGSYRASPGGCLRLR